MIEFPEKADQIKRWSQIFFFGLARILSISIILILLLILYFIVSRGISVISWEFLSAAPKESMTQGGIMPALVGTLYLIFWSMLIAFPIGVMAGIYVNEYSQDGRIKRFIKMMTNNLSGIPSIVFGLFGMALFVNYLNFGASILAGSLTLALLSLPLIIRTTEESLKSVDQGFRNGSYALGASKLYTIRKVVLPIAFPNIITGLILSIGRVSGETAPILFTCAAYFLPKLPSSVMEQCMALPYHLYVIATSGTDVAKTRPMAYGTALVLIIIVLIVNLFANLLRNYFASKVKMK
ncbi:MAG: phosphate ABC transporter permease PstA [Saprospiraceae bacterium]|nr:phosphate ABC transporter permease PstA [Saprospiraceae bacterium]MBK7811747.1 phosphate ABC transporter permease PstA [Saprospiraceae bacterium]MBK9631531.1 phosphate ABC transporter permease PstA [Saprospiraceae bacterium]